MVTVRYIVKNVEEAVAFYTSHLGFSVDQNFAPAIAILLLDDLRLLVSGPMASASKPMLDGRIPDSGGWNRFVIQVDDLTDYVKKLRGEGVPFINEILDGPGGQQIICVDPSGNPIELFQPA